MNRRALCRLLPASLRAGAARSAAQGSGVFRVAWVSLDEAASTLGKDLVHFPAASATEPSEALARMREPRVEALLVSSDRVVPGHAARIAEFSLCQRIPAVAGWSPFAQRGALLAHGPQFADVYRRRDSDADRIRKGAKPAELPIEQPSRFEFVVNLKTSNALGFTIPRNVLRRADEVIQ